MGRHLSFDLSIGEIEGPSARLQLDLTERRWWNFERDGMTRVFGVRGGDVVFHADEILLFDGDREVATITSVNALQLEVGDEGRGFAVATGRGFDWVCTVAED